MQSPNIFWTIKKAGEQFSSLTISDLVNYLSPAELARYQGMKIPKRRNEWLLGRMTAKGLLTYENFPLAGIGLKNLSIDNHPEGAPILTSHPEAGAISITHRAQVAAAAYSPDPNIQIGIDLEWVESRQFSFVEDFFTAHEVQFIQSLDAGVAIHDAIVTLIWSAKEAILKAWQKGLRLDTRHIEILPVNTILYQFDYAKPEVWQTLNWRTDLTGFPACWLGWRRWGNFILTFAVQNLYNEPDFTPQINEVNLKHLPF